MGKAILTRSRNQTTMQFLGTPEMYKLNVGDIVDLTYAGLGFSGKVCRVEALELQPNGLVAVSLIEYFDVYTWEVPPQEPVEELANLPSAYAVKAPAGLTFTDTDSSSTGRPFLSWNEPTDFPDYQYRINVVDSSSNQVLNRIVDVENCDLNFLPVNANYVASVTSLNTLGSESSAATLTFTIGDAPTGSADIKDGAVITDKLPDSTGTTDGVTGVKIADLAITNAKINDLNATKITAGIIDTARLNVSDIISTGNIIVTGDNISTLTNDSAFIDGSQVNTNVTSISGGAITTGTVAAARIDVSGVITAGSIIVSGDNISTLTNDSSFIDGTQVNSNVTSISGNVITTGTINASVVNLTNLNADNISTGTLNANNIQIDNVTIDTDGSGNLIIKSGGVSSTQIGTGAVTNDKVQSISATKITTDQLDSDRINVGTLNVEHFGDVSADIKSHLATETFVPLEVFGSVIQRGSTNFTVNTNTTGTYLSLTMNQIRDGAKYRAILTGVYGDCTAGYLEYSLNGTTWTQAAGGIQNITFAAGTFRTYVFAYSGTISGLSNTQSTVYWRLRWVTKLNSTYQSLYVFIDNTQ